MCCLPASALEVVVFILIFYVYPIQRALQIKQQRIQKMNKLIYCSCFYFSIKPNCPKFDLNIQQCSDAARVDLMLFPL